MYKQYGPIFRVQALNRTFTILAGLEANKFTTQHDEEVFTNEIDFQWVAQEVGPVLTSKPPEEHRYMRRLMRPAYARSLATQQIVLLVQTVDEFVDRLKPGDSFAVFPAMQELVVTQLGRTLLGQAPGEYFEDFRRFMLTLLQVHQFHTKPRWALKLPAYRRAKARVYEMTRQILERVRNAPTGEGNMPVALDILQKSVDVRGQPFSEAYFFAEVMGPYLAGQDTVAGTMNFICYILHKYRDVLERVAAEVRQGFANGIPSFEGFHRFETLHKTIQETMRRYPVAVAMPRHAARAFEFAGYRVDVGTPIFNATSVTHFLPEYYPDPYTFNIDRPRGPAGTFVPYGVGNYACLGAGIADVQLMVTMAALLRRARFELDPPGYEAKLQPMPLPNPGRYRLKLIEKYA
jgi:cytochrome P450